MHRSTLGAGNASSLGSVSIASCSLIWRTDPVSGILKTEHLHLLVGG